MQFDQNIWDNIELIKVLKSGGIAVMPTDTIYGMVGSALISKTVERIYEIRKRNLSKPCIILIGDIKDLEKFSIILNDEQSKEIEKHWSSEVSQDFQLRPVSIVFDCDNKNIEYLHRGTNSLALRLPRNENLRNLLNKVGPLIAPSANLEKFPESEDIIDARKYFGDKVDFYLDGGKITSKASKVIQLHKDGSVSILRE